MPIARYADLLWPDRVSVAGVLLNPHTLGHALLLERIKSPLAGAISAEAFDGFELPFGDVLLAAWICSRTWRQAFEQIDSRRAVLWLKWKAATRWRNRAHDQKKLLAYLDTAWPVINWWDTRPNTNGETRGTQMVHLLIASQREHYRASLEGALDVTTSAAKLDYLAHYEAEGRVRLWSDRDEEIARVFEEREKGAVRG